MATNSFRCTIVTPSEAVFDDEVSYATFPAWDGQLGVMTGQSPVLTRLGIGSMRMDLPGGDSRWYMVDGGFVQILENVVTVLTERATPAENVSGEGAESELAEANSRAVSGGGATAEDRRRVEADQQRARTRRAIAAGRAAGRASGQASRTGT